MRLSLLALAAAASAAAAASPIKNVIVICFENRAFDHLLGHLGVTNPDVDGLATPFCNRLNPQDPTSEQICVDMQFQQDEGPTDVCHSFDCISEQVYSVGTPEPGMVPNMGGFAASAVAQKNDLPFAFSAYNASTLPVLSTLATEFTLFDSWHVSVPTCTNPNREFMMSSTSHGYITNDFPTDGFPQQTHVKLLEAHGISWKIFYSDDTWMVPAFADLRTNASLSFVQEMPAFYADIANGTLPQYSFIQPRMATSSTGPSNWQHPDNSVEAGEQLLWDVYSALRNSSYWANSALIITYDEHGGFPDHQPNPQVGIPSPDNVTATNGFKFDRLGVRVPTVLVSPWAPKGLVVHDPVGVQAPFPTSKFEHTSVIATVNRIFGIDTIMTARDAWTGRFDNLLDGSFTGGKAREDCPEALPRPAPVSEARLAREADRLLNDHHLDSISILCRLLAKGRAEEEEEAADAAALHPVCTDSSDAEGQARLLAELRSRAGEPVARANDVEGVWQEAAAYPALHSPIARRLRQRDFGDLSKALTDAWRAQVRRAAERAERAAL